VIGGTDSGECGSEKKGESRKRVGVGGFLVSEPMKNNHLSKKKKVGGEKSGQERGA